MRNKISVIVFALLMLLSSVTFASDWSWQVAPNGLYFKRNAAGASTDGWYYLRYRTCGHYRCSCSYSFRQVTRISGYDEGDYANEKWREQLVKLAAEQVRANQRAEQRIASSEAFLKEWKAIFGDKPIPLSMGYQYGSGYQYGNNVNNTGSAFFSHQRIGASQYVAPQHVDQAMMFQQLYRLSESIIKASDSTANNYAALASQALEGQSRIQESQLKMSGALQFMQLAESQYRSSLREPQKAVAAGDLDAAVAAIFKNDCVSCHTKGGKAGHYPLDTRLDAIDKFTGLERWKIAALVSTAEMPPEGHDPASGESVAVLVEWSKLQDP